MRFIDLPSKIDHSEYEDLKSRIVESLDKEKIDSIYQIGSVRHPGISDLDIVVVFKPDSVYTEDPRKALNPEDGRILTHPLFGADREFFEESFQYSFFHNFQLLWGQDTRPQDGLPSEENQEILKRQIALEYLLKFHFVVQVQKWYGILKLRTFLLEAKAIAFDLEFLGYPEDHPLHQMIQKVIEWRDNWFTKPPSKKEIVRLIERLSNEVEEVLSQEFQKEAFFMKAKDKEKYNLNTEIIKASSFRVSKKGFPVSRIVSFDDKRYFNLMHRFNRFEIHLPHSWEKVPQIIGDRTTFADRFRNANSARYPYFSPVVSIFKVFE
ncbi:hypothetical protein N9N17_00450 [Schleiferiaceae bacterium]|nr:hypothetical protein [Schleiferiaceae bacterium]